MTKWSRYLQRITAGDTQAEVATKVGTEQTTVSRWLRGTTEPRDVAVVATVAEAYGANVLEALVEVGMLSPDQAGIPPSSPRPFEAVVDIDDSLSDAAKDHLKREYLFLQDASARSRSEMVVERIQDDPFLGDAMKQRLLEGLV